MSGERTPTGADCDLGTVAFVDACGSKHVAQVVGKMLQNTDMSNFFGYALFCSSDPGMIRNPKKN